MEKHLNLKLIGRALDRDIKAREYINTHIKKCLECKKKLQKMTREAWESLGGLEGAMNEALCTPDLTAKSDKCLTDKQIINLIYDKKRIYKMFDGIIYDEKNRKIKDETFSHIIKCPYCRPTFFNYLYAKNIMDIAEFDNKIRTNKAYRNELLKIDKGIKKFLLE